MMTTARAQIRTPGDVGLALQQARLEKGLTQMQLAELVGEPQSTISQMESGTVTIYVKRLLALGKVLDLQWWASWEHVEDNRSDAPDAREAQE